MTRNYIGLSCTPHDPSLAVLDAQGNLRFAEAIERPLQNKRGWFAPPDHVMHIGSIIERYCDPDAELVVAGTWARPMATSLYWIELALRLARRPPFSLLRVMPEIMLQNGTHMTNAHRAMLSQTGEGLAYRLLHARPSHPRVVRKVYDHHLTHAANAAYSSPFEEGVVVIVDGNGELRASSAYHYRNGELHELRAARGRLTASLGAFYAVLCEACGFDCYAGEEWKVMGLAPYGQFRQDYYDLLRSMIGLDGLRLKAGPRYGERCRELLALRPPPGSPSHAAADLAHTGQKVFCEIYLELMRRLHALGLSDNLVIAGGCALNSSANGMVLEHTPFKQLYVPSAPADDGNSVGAARLAYLDDHPRGLPPGRAAASPYLGSTMRASTLENLRRFGGLASARAVSDEALADEVARLLASGKIIGWVQGRSEFGPRALGNRSIIADPRDPQVKATINDRIKFREEFRPFAPSVLVEDGERLFEHYQPSPYMERTLRFSELGKAQVPGVVHVDGTGRLQTVSREMNPRYYQLIAAFKRLTGVPVLLNTSFNVMGKPIVHSVEDAVTVLMTSGLDVLVIDDWIFQKPQPARSAHEGERTATGDPTAREASQMLS